MASFEDYIDELLEEEGGSTVTDDPNDSGGLTKWGISQKAYPDLDIENLSREDAVEIYKRDYWNKMRLDDMPEHLRRDLFFAGVNMGVRNPLVKALQKQVGAKADGVIGKNTVAAINNYSDIENIDRAVLIDGAIDYYAELADKRPKDRKYLNGWMNRLVGEGARPFGKNAIDLRDMSADKIKEIAKNQLIFTPDAPQPEQPQIDPVGFLDNLMLLMQERLKAPQSGSQEVSEASTDEETEQQQVNPMIQQLAEVMKGQRRVNEAGLQRTYNEARLEEEARKEGYRPTGSSALVEALSKSEVIKSKTYDRSNLNQELHNRPTEELAGGSDDSRDPIYGIF